MVVWVILVVVEEDVLVSVVILVVLRTAAVHLEVVLVVVVVRVLAFGLCHAADVCVEDVETVAATTRTTTEVNWTVDGNVL